MQTAVSINRLGTTPESGCSISMMESETASSLYPLNGCGKLSTMEIVKNFCSLHGLNHGHVAPTRTISGLESLTEGRSWQEEFSDKHASHREIVFVADIPDYGFSIERT